MKTDRIARSLTSRRITGTLICAALLLVFSIRSAVAQTTITSRPTDGSTPLAMTPGAPAGSYALSGFDNVNLHNGNLNFHLPLLQIGGRGEAGYTMMLAVEQHWQVRHDTRITNCSPAGCNLQHNYYAEPTLWEPIVPGYGPGVMIGRSAGRTILNCGPSYTNFTTSLTRFTFMAADGTEYEFRDQATHGQPLESGCNQFPGPSRGTVFVTADGTSAVFVCDETVFDELSGPNRIFKSGHIKFRNGVVYQINSRGLVDWIRDRNGNTVQFVYDDSRRVTSIIDALNRTISITYGATFLDADLITFKGFGGTPRTIRVGGTAALNEPAINALRADYRAGGFKTYQQLFPSVLPSFTTPFSPINPTFVELPDGRRYRLYYNPYGELARVELPTGGAYEYEWGAGPACDQYGVVPGGGGVVPEYNIYRRVKEKRIYPDGGSVVTNSPFETKIKFIKGTNPDGREAPSIDVENRDWNNALLSKTTHYHYGTPSESFAVLPTEYPDWKAGREYQTETFDGANGRRVENTWAARITHAWAGEDPQLRDVKMTLTETNQVSKQHFDYDQYNNVTDASEYAYGSGTPGVLVRHKKTVYMDTTGYTGFGPGDPLLLSLATDEYIDDGVNTNNPSAHVSYEYDNYTEGVTDRSDITGHARTLIGPNKFGPTYTSRGNVTKITHWLLPNGVTITATPQSTQMQYDIAGNVLKSVDPMQHLTSYEVFDHFGTPNGEAQANDQMPVELGTTHKTYAFVTKVQNALSQATFTQYDYYIGKPVDVQDANNMVSSESYNDALDRPTLVDRASNTATNSGFRGQLRFIYNDPAHLITTTSDLNTYGDNLLSKTITYDGLGRTILSSTSAPDGTISRATKFDGLGRVKLVSNPYRAAAADTDGWTRTRYDGLNRVIEVATFSGSVNTLPPDIGTNANWTGSVATAYTGNQVTVTDQAGRKRRSTTDALSRLTQVDELNLSGTVYASTLYFYDLLDDLVKVQQGTQRRYFMYDSLKQLMRASNPEQNANPSIALTDPVSQNSQWSMAYDYNDDGNLSHRTDARNVKTTYNYDALHRVISRTYDNDPQSTPPVFYFYDSQALPGGAPSTFNRGSSVGRLVATIYGSNSSAGSYQGYDPVGRVTTSFQQTDGQNYQTTYGYNLAGAMVKEVYPSGRDVRMSYDAAARLARVDQYTNNTLTKNYVTVSSYAAQGAITSMTLGNGLVEQAGFNSRLQPVTIKLGTPSNPTSLLLLEYGYNSVGQVNNNGNLVQQKITAPQTNGQPVTMTQDYVYDQVNRLQSASENGGASWSEQFGYDLFGNMWVSGASGVTLSSLTPQSQSAYVQNPSNNRLQASTYDEAGNQKIDGQGRQFDYDGEGRQVRFNSGVGQYVYDGDGQRVKKVDGTGTTVFVYNIAGQLIGEYTSGNATGSGTSYLTADHLGSTRVVTRADGSVKVRYDYLPYGEELPSSLGGRSSVAGYGNADSTRQKFSANERDQETGLDYLLTRYYSSAQGRFTSADKPLIGQYEWNPQTWNLFIYADNNPLLYVDPTGEDYIVYDPNGRRKIIEDKDLEKYKFINQAGDGIWVTLEDANGVQYFGYFRDHEDAHDEDDPANDAYGDYFDNRVDFKFGDPGLRPDRLPDPREPWRTHYPVPPLPPRRDPFDFRNIFKKRDELRNKPGSLGKFKGTDALRRENKVVKDVVKELGLTKDQQRQLHDAISGEGYSYHEIKEIAKSMFGK